MENYERPGWLDRWGVILAATVLLVIILIAGSGCATSGMKLGVKQGHWEMQAAIACLKNGDIEGALYYANLSEETLHTWMDCYGFSEEEVSQITHAITLYRMRTEKTFISTISGVASNALGGQAWWTALLGAGGLGTIALGAALKYLQTRKELKKTQTDYTYAAEAATDMSTAIEKCNAKEVKEEVADYQSQRGYLPHQGSVDMYKPQG